MGGDPPEIHLKKDTHENVSWWIPSLVNFSFWAEEIDDGLFRVGRLRCDVGEDHVQFVGDLVEDLTGRGCGLRRNGRLQ